MAQKSTLSAPLAIIKVKGVAIGKMKTIRCTESMRLAPVGGIGQLHKDELKTVDWNGMLNCSAFLVDLSLALIPGSLNRNVQSVQQWENTILLQEDGVQIDIMRKVAASTTPGGIIIPTLQVVASIVGCFISKEGWDITEGQVSGRDCDFEYTTPIIFPV